ncbi:alpha/beta fold hydrolase [Paenibacillus tarimensis]
MDPTETGYVPVEDGKLYYELCDNSGPPVILLHAHSVDLRMWEPQMSLLSESYRVIRYDFRGYGRSDLPVNKRFRHVDDLVQLMDDLEIDRTHLVGLSLGSLVSLDMLALYPERVLSASLASGALYTDGKGEPEEPARPSGALSGSELTAYKEKWLHDLLAMCGPERLRIENDLRTMISHWSAWQPMYETCRPLLGPSLIRRLRETDPSIPVLAVIGEEDSEGSRRSSEALLSLRPTAQAVRLPGSGHFSNMETPDLFNNEILRFLQAQF